MTETEDYDKSATPTAHASTHESGGSDELDVSGLVHKSTFLGVLSGNQTIQDNTQTVIEIDTEIVDRNNDFNTSNHRFTAPEAGKYLVIGQATMNQLGANKWQYLHIRVNGVAVAFGLTAMSVVVYMSFAQGTILDLAANDYVTLEIIHNHGAARDIIAASRQTYFMVTRLY